jgi:DNA-binding beta-propeller fold protein YncE
VLESTPAILIYSISGTTTKTFASIGSFSTGSGVGALNVPEFLTLDFNNNVYVTNCGTLDNIVKYSPTGASPVSFGSAVLTVPYGIVVDGAGNVLVSQCTTPGFIQEFNPSGSTYSAGATFGNSVLNLPLGLTLDGSSNLYVADKGSNQILEFKNTN